MNKNKKGEGNGVGILLIVAITIIVGLVCFQVIAQNVGQSTNTITLANQSLGSAIVNGTPQYITNCKALSGVVIFNATNDVQIPSTNYTTVDNFLYNGALTVQVNPNASSVVPQGYNKGLWKVSGTCQTPDYISDSGGRAVAGLIVIMFALAILVVALSPVLRGELADLVRE